MYLHTRMTEFFLNCRCLVCLAFYISAKMSNQGSWSRMSLSSQNRYKCKPVAYSVGDACLLNYPLFYTALC